MNLVIVTVKFLQNLAEMVSAFYRNSHQGGPHSQHQRNASPQRNRDVTGFYNWQSTQLTVKERLTFLFNNTILSDVTFVVGRDNQQQRIPAHRFVLSGSNSF